MTKTNFLILILIFASLSCSARTDDDLELSIITKGEFYVGKNMNFLPVKHSYLAAIKNKYLVFKILPVSQTDGDISWNGGNTHYFKNSTFIEWALYSEEMVRISKGQKEVTSGGWYPEGISLKELNKHVIWDSFVQVGDIKLRFNPDAAQYCWGKFYSKCMLGIMKKNELSDITFSDIKSVKFYDVYH